MKILYAIFAIVAMVVELPASDYAQSAQVEEQEQFLPNNPGLSEFFYIENGQKIATRIDESIHSLWTPTEEQIVSASPVQMGGSPRSGFNHLVVGQDHYLIGVYMSDALPSWISNGSLWIKVDDRRFVDLDTGIVTQIDKNVFWEKATPLRQIPRTW